MSRMANRGAAAILNAVLWGSGYLYSKRGAAGILAILAHLSLYTWLVVLGLTNVVSALLVLGPIFFFGSLYFARDAYKFPSTTNPSLKVKVQTEGKSKASQRRVCDDCGASLSFTAKFCSECGASQSEQPSS